MIVEFIGDCEKLIAGVADLLQGQNLDVYLGEIPKQKETNLLFEEIKKQIEESIEQNADYAFLSCGLWELHKIGDSNLYKKIDKVVSLQKDDELVNQMKRNVLFLDPNESLDLQKEKVLQFLLVPS